MSATTTIHYTINHFVTVNTSTSTESIYSTTLHGDDTVHIWFSNLSDYQTESADIIIEQPPTGFHWEIDMHGYTEHPPELNPESYISEVKNITTETEFTTIKDAYTSEEIKRVSPWDTPLTDTYTQP